MLWLDRMLATKERVRSDMELLNDEALASADEKRRHGRTPYLKVAKLTLENNSASHTVFTRDVSLDGVGLLHRMPIEPQDATLVLELNSGAIVQLRLFLNWCISLGEGWFISGGDYVPSHSPTSDNQFSDIQTSNNQTPELVTGKIVGG